MTDYRRAFKIACELLNGDVLYGIDADTIFKIMMNKDGMTSSSSYEEYILNHLQDLDHGQYAIKALEREPTTKNDLGVDCISRKDVDVLVWEYLKENTDNHVAFYEHLLDLPSVYPKIEPRKGHWCPQNDDYFDWYECSECGYGSDGEMQYSSDYDVRTNFCPNCGAKMESEDKG